MPFSASHQCLHYTQFDRSDMPVTALAKDYPHGHTTGRHSHPHAQLIYAVRGVMLVGTDQGHLMQLLLDEIKDVQPFSLQLPNPQDTRLVHITQTLSQNPEDDTTVEQWAVRLRITPKTIHRLFVKETGMTFGQWRQQARLLTALERLAQGEKVLSVALGLGYNSPSAFATMFKRQFDVPPSRFFDQLS